MTGAIIIIPSRDLADYVNRRCAECESLGVYKVVDEYPKLYVLLRLLNAYRPDVILLEVGDSEEGWSAAGEIRSESPEVAIVGFSRGGEMEKRPEAASLVSEILHEPFTPGDLQRAISRALKAHQQQARENVFAFLPAKAGSGASTTALNMAGSLVRYWRQKVLALEADLHSGCLSILFKLEPKRSIIEVLEDPDLLQERQFARLLSQAEGIDLLLTSRARTTAKVSPWDYQKLVGVASQRYDAVIVDLPEVVNDATEAIVTRAKQVFIVCTPELPSLFLARRRAHELESRGVAVDRIGIVLNRYAEMFETVEQLEELLAKPLSAVLPNDYLSVREAALGSGLVDGATELAHAYVALAQKLTGTEPVVAPPEVPEEPAKRPHTMKSFFTENLRGLLSRGPSKGSH